MLRPFILCFFILMIAVAPAPAQDGIPAETLAALKRATVFVQTSGSTWKSSGSGFVVSVQKDFVLIATNHHVVASPDSEKNARMTPQELVRSLKQVAVSVVFDPGTKNEQSVKADPIAADPDTDLAILKVARPKDPPAPIDILGAPKPTETMPVYIFGFPFGQILAMGGAKGSPAITVGKGTVSSLRLDEVGDLAMVQIDGALNPGNSGGPVLDAKGKLIGIAVATLRSGQGIGFAIPASELAEVMKGRLGNVMYSINRPAPGKISLHVDVEVVDPSSAVRGVSFRYLQVPLGGPKPGPGDLLAKQAGVQKVAMKVVDGVASGDVAIDASLGDIFIQAVPEGGAGDAGATRTRPLTPAAGKSGSGTVDDSSPFALDPNAKAPPGWKDYSPKDRSYSIWIPAKARSQRERERTMTYHDQPMKANIVSVEMPNGLTYMAQVLIVQNVNTKDHRAGFEEFLRELLLSETRGRVTTEKNIQVGSIPGKEYRIEAGRTVVRARVAVAGNWILLLQALGSGSTADSENVQTFFTSCRISAEARPTTPTPGTGLPGGFPGAGTPSAPSFPPPPNTGGFPSNQPSTPATAIGADRKTKIQGGFNEPEFVDEGQAGALLVGLDIGLGKFFDNAIVSAVRPVFRTTDRDTEGAWHGPFVGKQLGRVVAKPGYAVGAITVNTGLGIDGLSITFMKLANGRLDPLDSYESPWIGGPGGHSGKVKLGGDGTLTVGLIGKAKADAVTGLGLLYTVPALQAPPPQFAGTAPPAAPQVPAGWGTAAPASPFPSAQPNNAPSFPAQPPSTPMNFERPALTAPPAAAAEAAPTNRTRMIFGIIAGVVLVGAVFILVIIGGFMMMANRRRSRRVVIDDGRRRSSRRSRRGYY